MECCITLDPSLGDHSRIAVPDQLKMQLMEENHSGDLSGHLAAKTLYTTMTQLYYWDDRNGNIPKIVHGCLICASHRGTGRKHRALLQSIPVSSTFERVGVHIMEMPQTERSNRYVIVFSGSVCDGRSD